MKPNVIFGVVLLAVVALGGVVFLKRHAPAPAPAPVAAAAPAPQASTAAMPAPLPLPTATASTPAPAPVTPEEEIDRLQDWSRNDDPQSLSNILADLTSPDKDVREAAIEAAKQFGSTNAIPALKAAAMNSSDTDEQVEMLQAAQFLALPPMDVTPPTPEQLAEGQKRVAEMRAKEAQMRATLQSQMQAQSQQGQGQSAPQPQQ